MYLKISVPWRNGVASERVKASRGWVRLAGRRGLRDSATCSWLQEPSAILLRCVRVTCGCLRLGSGTHAGPERGEFRRRLFLLYYYYPFYECGPDFDFVRVARTAGVREESLNQATAFLPSSGEFLKEQTFVFILSHFINLSDF